MKRREVRVCRRSWAIFKRPRMRPVGIIKCCGLNTSRSMRAEKQAVFIQIILSHNNSRKLSWQNRCVIFSSFSSFFSSVFSIVQFFFHFSSGTNKDYDKLFKSVMQNNSSLEREVARLRKCVQNLKADLVKVQLFFFPSKVRWNWNMFFSLQYQARDPSRVQLKHPGSMSPDKRNASETDLVKRESSGTEGASTPKGGGSQGVAGDAGDGTDAKGDVKDLKKQLKYASLHFRLFRVFF